MSRLLKIAVREYVAYVRTVGFWLSLLLMPSILALTICAPAMMERSEPVPRLAVIDLTGQGYAADIAEAVKARGPGRRGAGDRPLARITPAPIGSVQDAAEAGRRLRPLMQGREPPIDAAAVVRREGGEVAVDVWTRSLANQDLQGVIRRAVTDRMRTDRLKAAGVPASEIAALEAMEPKVLAFSPRAQSGRIQMRDRLPGMLGFGLGMMLWAMIMSGAGILLNSVIEEKSSRILEVLLASASAPEIMGGKILGVAGVTATVLGAWLSLGALGLAAAAPELASDVVAVLLRDGMAAYFLVFLAGGYLMYAGLFAAVGSFCETNREAQTVLAPLMVLLSIPVVFMGQAIMRPEAPVLAALSWFPPFTPFLMPVRAAAGPPMWQMAMAALLCAGTAAASLWASTQAFRVGALSSGKADLRNLLRALAGRGRGGS